MYLQSLVIKISKSENDNIELYGNRIISLIGSNLFYR